MVIDHSYKISIFGEFSDIIPTTENMMFFLESFKDYGLMPSLFQELQIDNNNPQPITQQRIALISNDSKEQVSIASNRIDYEVTSTDDVKLSEEYRKGLNTKICGVFKCIFERFNKKAVRLALNALGLVVNLDENQVASFMEKYSNPISIYTPTDLKEWNTRLMVRKNENIGANLEQFNVITALSKATLHKTVNGQLIEFDGFSVHVDINTIAENMHPRFSSPDLSEFIGVATVWWDTIILEMG